MKQLLLLTLLSSLSIIHTTRVVLVTGGDPGYDFFPLCTDYLEFNVLGPRELHIFFTNAHHVTRPSYEIVLGGWENKKSAIRKDLKEKVWHDGTVVQEGVYQRYWVSLNHTSESISVGKQRLRPFLYLHDPNYVNMRYFGVKSGPGIKATWDFDFKTLSSCYCKSGKGQ